MPMKLVVVGPEEPLRQHSMLANDRDELTNCPGLLDRVQIVRLGTILTDISFRVSKYCIHNYYTLPIYSFSLQTSHKYI
jgi:hypothetical protein